MRRNILRDLESVKINVLDGACLGVVYCIVLS